MRARRDPRELGEVATEVRLIGVTMAVGDLRERTVRAEGALEATHAGVRLRSKPHRRGEHRDARAMAIAGLLDRGGDGRAAPEDAKHLAHGGRERGGAQALDEKPLEDTPRPLFRS